MSTTLSQNRNLTTFTAAANLFWTGEKIMISDIVSSFDRVDIVVMFKMYKQHTRTLQEPVAVQSGLASMLAQPCKCVPVLSLSG